MQRMKLSRMLLYFRCYDVEQRENEMRDEIYKEAEDDAKNYDFDENGNIVK